ncbi:MAG: SDR family oxidoreductase [Thermoanaerobaculia bacterium]
MGISNPTDIADTPIFVTGASGYIGGRLVPRLLERGYRVRCLARSPKKLESRPWAGQPTVEIVAGDVGDTALLAEQMRGCRAAYYLVHSMLAAGPAYASKDAELARAFSTAAANAGCERILYLGGLGETGEGLSEHLTSRRETETLLASGPVPVTVLRAAMIIGAGSASFEILRYLVERLPVMVTPRWVQTEGQPIAVHNVIEYLLDALVMEETIGRTLDIGGPDVLSYRDMMGVMAEALGLRHRLVIPIPVLTPRLSSLWIQLVTPLSHHIARPLAEGLRNRVVCRDKTAQSLMPQRLLGVREAIDEALGNLDLGDVETSWTDAGAIPGDPDWAGGTTYVHQEETQVAASSSDVFRAICRIGGRNGWYSSQILWRIRGGIDRLLGGPGLRRGRRHAEEIRHGDALDFWRVAGIERDRWLKLRAEMVLPGEALLEFRIESVPGFAGRCLLFQTARFKPKGLLGILYWYSVLPFHGFIFRSMINGIRRAAQQIELDRWVDDPGPTS